FDTTVIYNYPKSYFFELSYSYWNYLVIMTICDHVSETVLNDDDIFESSEA
ncbi:6490_t:CDS:2, partial [Gigaspora rosea]